jgi:hypothetical protein
MDEASGGKVGMEQFFGMNGYPEVSGESTPTDFDRCMSMYVHLNFIGFSADKQLTDEARILASVRDAQHVDDAAPLEQPLEVTRQQLMRPK